MKQSSGQYLLHRRKEKLSETKQAKNSAEFQRNCSMCCTFK